MLVNAVARNKAVYVCRPHYMPPIGQAAPKHASRAVDICMGTPTTKRGYIRHAQSSTDGAQSSSLENKQHWIGRMSEGEDGRV